MKRVMLVRPARSHPVYVKDQTKQSGLSTPSPSPSKEGRRGWGNTQPQATEQKKSVEELILLANLLTPSERKELLARLALTSQTLPIEQTRDVDMWAQAVYEALVAAVGYEGEGVQGPALVKRSVGNPAAWGPVSNFMKASKLDGLKVTERQAVYLMLAKLVVSNARGVARHADIPLSAKLVGTCSSNITGIFEQSFPGYLQSGLVLMVARRLTGPVHLAKD